MNAKEKAKELLEKYDELAFRPSPLFNRNYEGEYANAKRIAIISIDEITSALDEVSVAESGTTKIDYGQSFWNEVKAEVVKY